MERERLQTKTADSYGEPYPGDGKNTCIVLWMLISSNIFRDGTFLELSHYCFGSETLKIFDMENLKDASKLCRAKMSLIRNLTCLAVSSTKEEIMWT